MVLWLKVDVGVSRAVSGSTRTVWDEARSRMVAVNRALEELEASEKAVERAEDGAIARLANAQEQVEATDGYRVDETIAGYVRSCDHFVVLALTWCTLEHFCNSFNPLLASGDTPDKRWFCRL